ncbi:MAG: TlpA disulfide reductase family protein, partial [Chloroflexota bacterium]
DTDQAARDFIKQFNITYPNGPDLGSNIYRLYRARGVPETFFIDQQGNVARTIIGPMGEVTLRNAIEELLDKAAH